MSQRNAILRACAALLDASYQIDDTAKADIWRELASAAAAQGDRLAYERRMFRRRLVECRPWVGVCPLAADGIQEVSAVRDLADDTLTEVPE